MVILCCFHIFLGMTDHGLFCVCKYITTNLSTFTAAQYGVLSAHHISTNASTRLSSGYTALHYAAQNNNLESTKALLSKDNTRVDGFSKANGGCGATPLHRASFSGACSCMELLVKNGANLYAQDESFGDLMTPLHKAVSGGRYGGVESIRKIAIIIIM